MTVRTKLLIGMVLAPVLWGVACHDDDGPTAAPIPPGVEALRASLAPYSSLQLAKDAGYATALTDCMSNGDEGAMGVHFGNVGLIDGVSDALHPEVLVYEPGQGGSMSLVGVEFVVPYTIVPKTGTAPTLFGQSFVQNDVFGLWTLHVWTHRSNPSGLFASWNPRVHC